VDIFVRDFRLLVFLVALADCQRVYSLGDWRWAMSDRDASHLLEQLQQARSHSERLEKAIELEKLEYENERLLQAVTQWSFTCHQLRLDMDRLRSEAEALRNEVSILRMAKGAAGE